MTSSLDSDTPVVSEYSIQAPSGTRRDYTRYDRSMTADVSRLPVLLVTLGGGPTATNNIIEDVVVRVG